MNRAVRAGLELLQERGAGTLAHPGGTLLGHLGRVADRLASHGHDDAVVAAGACHAAYGTAGYTTGLVARTERQLLVDRIGSRAERFVWAYAALDRVALGGDFRPGASRWRDRVSGRPLAVGLDDRLAVIAITVANELDVLVHADDLAPAMRDEIESMLRSTRGLMTPDAWQDVTRHVTIRGQARVWTQS